MICVCISVLLVRDGHLSHNNVTHIKRLRLSSFNPLSLHFSPSISSSVCQSLSQFLTPPPVHLQPIYPSPHLSKKVRPRDADDKRACTKRRLALEGWMCDNKVWLFPDSLTMSVAVKEENGCCKSPSGMHNMETLLNLHGRTYRVSVTKRHSNLLTHIRHMHMLLYVHTILYVHIHGHTNTLACTHKIINGGGESPSAVGE